MKRFRSLSVLGALLLLGCASDPTSEGCQTDLCRRQVERIIEQERLRAIRQETMEERAEREAEAAGERGVTRAVRKVEGWIWQQIEGRN